MSAPRKKHARGRASARLAAVQALYQIDLAEAGPETVIAEFTEHRLAVVEYQGRARADRDLFADLVRGVVARRADLDARIAPLLGKGWTIARLDRVLCAIVRAGAYEIVARIDVPARVVISEYVDVAHAFFERGEPAFINGVLDRLAREARPGELEGATGGHADRG